MIQSPANVPLKYKLKGQGTTTLTLVLQRTRPAGEDAIEAIDSSMFLSYIRAAKAAFAKGSGGQITIHITLTHAVRAKIQRRGPQLLIVLPRYGRRF